MPDEALQTAFEIKTTCDEISRKLLRWHWENKPGEHSLGALLDHIRTRQQESPEYYDRLPDLAGRNSWQQLDTTLCMRVLLDPEKDAAHQLRIIWAAAGPKSPLRRQPRKRKPLARQSPARALRAGRKRGLPVTHLAAAAQSRTRAAAAPAADPRTGSRAATGTAVPGPDRSRNRPIAPFCWYCWRSWPWAC